MINFKYQSYRVSPKTAEVKIPDVERKTPVSLDPHNPGLDQQNRSDLESRLRSQMNLMPTEPRVMEDYLRARQKLCSLQSHAGYEHIQSVWDHMIDAIGHQILGKVMVAFDYESDAAIQAFRVACSLAQVFGCQIHVVRVISTHDRDAVIQAKQELDQFIENQSHPFGQGVEFWNSKITTMIHQNQFSDDGLMEVILQQRPHLVLVGSDRKPALKKIVLGSVAESLVQRCVCPLMIVRSNPIQNFPPKSILVAFRSLANVIESLRFILTLARAFGSRVDLLHVFDSIEDQIEHQTQIEGALQKIDWADVQCRGAFGTGNVTEQILSYCEQEKIDLLAMTTHVTDFFQKSVTLDVLNRSNKQALVFHERHGLE